MANELLIRCPVCLHKHSVPKSISVNELLTCKRCNRQFEFQNALPNKDSAVTRTTPVMTTEYSVVEEVGFQFWLFSLILCLFTIPLIRNHVVDMKGSEFLWFYLVLFLVLWVGSTLLRWLWKEHSAISLIGFVIYEGAAILRVFDGWSQGMRDFEITVFMMIAGGIIFFLRVEHMNKNGDSGGCGGGCGSGCGGCGGCGG